MASPNAGPITGRELIRVIQGGNAVLLNRTDFATLLGKTALSSPRPLNAPGVITGAETVEAIQAGTAITMNAADLVAYAGGTAVPDTVPQRYRATDLTGTERIRGEQAGWDIAWSTDEVNAILGAPLPTPAPVFTTQPSMSPTSGTAGTTVFTANNGAASNATTYTRRWLLDGAPIGTGSTVTPATAGNLVLEVTATGPGGSAVATSPASVVSGAVSNLTLAQKGFPALFRNGGMPVNYTEASPGVFDTDYSEATFADTGTMYYVATTGNDANDGLSTGTAKRTIQSAIDTAPTGSRITLGSGRFGAGSVPTGKSLSFYGPTARDAYVGDLLAEADVSAFGAVGTNGQTITLTSGAVCGFVDLTKTRRQDRQTRAIPQVSKVAATAAEIATLRGSTTTEIERDLYGTPIGTADPIAGVFRSTPSSIGTSDNRSVQGQLDSTVLMWRTTAAQPLTLVGTARVFAKNISFVGGNVATPNTARLVVDNCRSLGGNNANLSEQFSVLGQAVFYRTTVRGCATTNQDLIDYSGIATGLEIECFLDQCSGIGGDNNSTVHGGRVFRINSTYLDGSRAVNDVEGSIVGMVGCIYRGSATGYSISGGDGEVHIAAATIIPGALGDYVLQSKAATYPTSRGYFYDSSMDGYTQATSPTQELPILPPTYRKIAKPTAETVFFGTTLSMDRLFQDAAGTTQVTAFGQPVGRIVSAVNTADYMTVVGGTCTYESDNGRPVLRSGTANSLRFSVFLNSGVFEESTNIIFGVKSSDTTGFLGTLTSTNAFGDYRGSSNLTGATSLSTAKVAPGFHVGSPVYTVDGSTTALTTAPPLRSAAFNGAPHVITVAGANLSFVGWARLPNLLFQFDGDIYGIEFSRSPDAASLRSRQQVRATEAGATLV